MDCLMLCAAARSRVVAAFLGLALVVVSACSPPGNGRAALAVVAALECDVRAREGRQIAAWAARAEQKLDVALGLIAQRPERRYGGILEVWDMTTRPWSKAFLVDVGGDVGYAGRVHARLRLLLRKKAFEPLRHWLREGEPAVRHAAAGALGAVGGADAVPDLIEALADDNVVVVQFVGNALVAIGAPAVVPLKKAVGGHGNRWVRIGAARALGRIGDREGVVPVVGFLERECRGTGAEALAAALAGAEALGRLGDERGVEPLLALLESKDIRMRSAAARALGALMANRRRRAAGARTAFAERVVGALVEALGARHRDVRGAAAGALGQIGWSPSGHEERIVFLVARMDWDSLAQVRPAAPVVSALVALLDGERFEPSEMRIAEDMRRGIAATLAEIGVPAVGALLARMADRGKPVGVRATAALALGEVGGAAAARALAQALADEDRRVRDEAAEGLGKIGGREAVGALVQALAAVPPEEHKPLTTALAACEMRAVRQLLGALASESRQVRKGAASALGRAGDALKPLLRDATRDASPRVALGARGALGVRYAIDKVEEHRRDRHEKWGRRPAADPARTARVGGRARVVGSIERCADLREAGRRLDVRALCVLPRVLSDRDDSPRVRRVAARALGDLGLAAQATLPSLDRVAGDAAQPVELRNEAADAAARIRRASEAATPRDRVWALVRLVAVADDHLDYGHVRLAAVEALAALGYPAHLALPVLENLAGMKYLPRDLRTAARTAAAAVGKQSRATPGTSGAALVPILIEVLELEMVYPHPRAVVAAEMLGRLGAAKALPQLYEATEIPIINTKQYQRRHLRRAAREAVARIRDAQGARGPRGRRRAEGRSP